MDDAHPWQAARYIDLNPVRANLVKSPGAWRWSSARARIRRRSADPLVSPDCPLLDAREAASWKAFLSAGLTDDEREMLRRHERTGRPLGPPSFIEKLSRLLDRDLTRKKPGRKSKRKVI